MTQPDTTPDLSPLERAVINRLQRGLPLEHRPFLTLAEELGVDENTLIKTVAHLLERGIATRFGPLYDIERFGGLFCLCAVAAGDRWPEVADIINSFDEVAHNYLRDHPYNLWFVLAVDSPEALERTVTAIEQRTGLAVLQLPKEREYKIQLHFEVPEHDG